MHAWGMVGRDKSREEGGGEGEWRGDRLAGLVQVQKSVISNHELPVCFPFVSNSTEKFTCCHKNIPPLPPIPPSLSLSLSHFHIPTPSLSIFPFYFFGSLSLLKDNSINYFSCSPVLLKGNLIKITFQTSISIIYPGLYQFFTPILFFCKNNYFFYKTRINAYNTNPPSICFPKFFYREGNRTMNQLFS